MQKRDKTTVQLTTLFYCSEIYEDSSNVIDKSISERMAHNEPHLTLEFLEECIEGFSKSSIEMKHLCLEYMTPWLQNLTRFCRQDEHKQQKVKFILDKLISLTIDEKKMYPSIQAKIWGNIGRVPELLDMVLDSFIHRSAICGPGSLNADIIANSAVALAAANVQLVSKIVITRLHENLERTCNYEYMTLTSLEQNVHWNEIANHLRYLLMLSFNNSLDVSSHLPLLFHITTLLVCTGDLTLRASMHGFVINIIHSLCTCEDMKQLKEETLRQLHHYLTEFTLPKYYQVFGIQNVKSAAISAFRHSNDNKDDRVRLSLSSLELLTDTLLEIMGAVMKEMPNYEWLDKWIELAKRFAFQHNPALQPRAIIVFGCISKAVTDLDIKQLLKIMAKGLQSYAREVGVDQRGAKSMTASHHTDSSISPTRGDLLLIEAVVMCLTRLLPLLPPDSPIHQHMFWVAVGVLQLDEVSLYAAGLALLEQNLDTQDQHGVFDSDPLEQVMMRCREHFILQCKQVDNAVGISFKDNFNFALVGHLLKGFRHPESTTVSRTIRVLNMVLTITARPEKRDKYEVTRQSVAYLAALVSVSEDVRSRCHLKNRIPGQLSGVCGPAGFCGPGIGLSGGIGLQSSEGGCIPVSASEEELGHLCLGTWPTTYGILPPVSPNPCGGGSSAGSSGGAGGSGGGGTARQKSWESSPESSASAMLGGPSTGPPRSPQPQSAPPGCSTPSGLALLPYPVPGSQAFQQQQQQSAQVQAPSFSPPSQQQCQVSQVVAVNASLRPFATPVQAPIPTPWRSFDLDWSQSRGSRQATTTSTCFKPLTQRSTSLPQRSRSVDTAASGVAASSMLPHHHLHHQQPQASPHPSRLPTLPPMGDGHQEGEARSPRGSVSHENNVLLEPEVLVDEATQALTLTVLATLVRNTTDENQARILYEYLADASLVFPRVFPVIHNLLDSKINYVLAHCHDHIILSAVQSIIQNMVCSSSEVVQQQLPYLQSIGFGGLWRFSGQFAKSNQNRETAELFVNVLDIIMDSELPADDFGPSYGRSVSTTVRPGGVHISSCSLNSLSLGSLQSPTEKDSSVIPGSGGAGDNSSNGATSALGRVRHGSASQISIRRLSNFKRQENASTPPNDEGATCGSSVTTEDSLSLGSETCSLNQWRNSGAPPKVQIFGADDGIDATSTTLLLGESDSDDEDDDVESEETNDLMDVNSSMS